MYHVPHELMSSHFCYRVLETLPLYDILNEFQKGHSHMAVVIRRSNKTGEKPAGKPGECKPTPFEELLKLKLF